MATLRNKRKLAAVTRETHAENPRNGQSRNTSVPRINEDYITQLSEEIEGRLTKKLSQEYSTTESRILGALSKLDESLLNQQIQTLSGTVPETIRNTNVDIQGTNEDNSQSDPHPEVGLFRSQTTQNSGQEVYPYLETTHGIGGISFCWSPGCQSLFRSGNVAFLVKMLGCSLDTTSYTVVCVLFLRFVLPGKWPVCCIGSNVTSLCGVIRFATCHTGRLENSRFSVNFVILGVRVNCVTVISSIILFAFNLLFVHHSVHLSLIRIFQTV